MRRKKGRYIVLAVAIAGFAAVAGSAFAEQSYPDASGDAGPGTDITGITVRHDASGLISIQVAAANPIVSNHAVSIGINADRNASTGDQGDEFWMYGGPLVGAGFFNCTSGSCTEASPASFSVGPAAANVTEFRLNRADIGNVSIFDFYASSISIDESGGSFQVKLWDIAPEGTAYFTYDLTVAQCANGTDDDGDGKIDGQDLGCASATDNNESDDPVTLKAGKAAAKPAKPKAGTKVVVSAAVTRVETGAPIDAGAVTCAARVVGGKAFRGAGNVTGGRAVCTFKVPANAAKKLVRGTITVAYETARVSVPFSFRVA